MSLTDRSAMLGAIKAAKVKLAENRAGGLLSAESHAAGKSAPDTSAAPKPGGSIHPSTPFPQDPAEADDNQDGASSEASSSFATTSIASKSSATANFSLRFDVTPDFMRIGPRGARRDASGVASLGGKPSRADRMAAQGLTSAKDNRGHFVQSWASKLEAFVQDPSQTKLELPAELSAYDRRELHMLASKFNLSHHSEGRGRARHLVLLKDALFFQAPTIRPSDLDIEKQRAQPKSAYTLQLERKEAEAALTEDEKYSNANLVRVNEKLRRATDSHARAVDSFVSAEEVAASMSQRGGSQQHQQQHGGGTSASATSMAVQMKHQLETKVQESSWSAVLQQQQDKLASHHSDGGKENQQPSAAAPSTQPDQLTFERCTSCGEEAEVTYELSSWDCNGECPNCRRVTIWKLVTRAKPAVVPVEEEEEASSSKKKRERDEDDNNETVEPASKTARTEKTAIVVDDEEGKQEDDDAPPPAEHLTPEQVVEIATLNELHKKNVTFLEAFSKSTQSKPDGDRIVFCIDFSDLETALPRCFTTNQPQDEEDRKSTIYVRFEEPLESAQQEDCKKGLVAQQFQLLIRGINQEAARLAALEETGGGSAVTVLDVCIALPASPSYDLPVECTVALLLLSANGQRESAKAVVESAAKSACAEGVRVGSKLEEIL